VGASTVARAGAAEQAKKAEKTAKHTDLFKKRFIRKMQPDPERARVWTRATD
jgi:hypothetical protein